MTKDDCACDRPKNKQQFCFYLINHSRNSVRKRRHLKENAQRKNIAVNRSLILAVMCVLRLLFVADEREVVENFDGVNTHSRICRGN